MEELETPPQPAPEQPQEAQPAEVTQLPAPPAGDPPEAPPVQEPPAPETALPVVEPPPPEPPSPDQDPEPPITEDRLESPAGEASPDERRGLVAVPHRAEPAVPDTASMEELLAPDGPGEQGDVPEPVAIEDIQLRAMLEAIIYVAEEPLTPAQIAAALIQPVARIEDLIGQLVGEFDRPEHGVAIREVAGGYKMTTKAEHHEAVRSFVKSLKPPLKLSLPALETLAVIAYKQPVTGPEVMEIRGVQGAGVFKTLLDRKLIAAAGRKNVIGKPILYKTTKEFLIQFGLKDLSELPSLKEFEEIRRMALADSEPPVAESAPAEPVLADDTKGSSAPPAPPEEQNG